MSGGGVLTLGYVQFLPLWCNMALAEVSLKRPFPAGPSIPAMVKGDENTKSRSSPASDALSKKLGCVCVSLCDICFLNWENQLAFLVW